MGLTSNRRCNCLHVYNNGQKVVGSGSNISPYIHERALIVDIADPYSGQSLETVDGSAIYSIPIQTQILDVETSGRFSGDVFGQVTYSPGIEQLTVVGHYSDSARLNSPAPMVYGKEGGLLSFVSVGDENSDVPVDLEGFTQHLWGMNPKTGVSSYVQLHDAPENVSDFQVEGNFGSSFGNATSLALGTKLSRTTTVLSKITLWFSEDNHNGTSAPFTTPPVVPFNTNESGSLNIVRMADNTLIGRGYWSQNGSVTNFKPLTFMDLQQIVGIEPTIGFKILINNFMPGPRHFQIRYSINYTLI